MVLIDDRLLWHVAAKLREFNVQCDAGCQFSDADISSLEPLVSRQQVPTPAQLETLWRMMQWPAGSVDCWYSVHEITGCSFDLFIHTQFNILVFLKNCIILFM